MSVITRLLTPTYIRMVAVGCALSGATADAAAQTSKKSERTDAIQVAPGTRGWKVTSTETNGAYSLAEAVRPPGNGPVPHRHSREDEAFYILEGELEFKIGKQTITAGSGSFVFAPRGVPHSFRISSPTPARYLAIISPGGLEKFFAERGALGQQLARDLETADPSQVQAYKALVDKYGLEYSPTWSFP